MTCAPLSPLLLAVTSATNVAEAKLEIRDVQASHGSLGPVRKSARYVSGDQVFVRYTIAGVLTDADGRVRLELRLAVADVAGKQILKSEIAAQPDWSLWAGAVIPGFATFDLGEEVPPGEYEMKVEVTDLIAKETASFRHRFTCTKEEFALVQVRFSHDAAGDVHASPGGLVSQALHVRMKAIGFDKSKNEIDVEMEIDVLDAAGKPVMPRPIRTGVHNEKPEEVKQITRLALSAVLSLNRPGDFTLRITVTDKLAMKKVVFESPLRVTVPVRDRRPHARETLLRERPFLGGRRRRVGVPGLRFRRPSRSTGGKSSTWDTGTGDELPPPPAAEVAHAR